MARRIRLDKGFFGTDVGEISDDGRILIPDGILGKDVVGRFRDDGIYIPDGFGERKAVDLYPDGSLHLTKDKGLFRAGTRIGAIDPDGTLRDADGRRVGELRPQRGDDHDDAVGRAISGASRFARNPKGKGGTGGHGGMGFIALLPTIGLAIITPIGAVVLFPALLESSSVSLSSKIQLIVVASAAIATAALAGALSGEKPLRFDKALPDMITASWLVGAVLNVILSVALEPEPLGFLDWLLLLLFGSLVCLGWAAAASLIAFVVLKIFLPKA